MLNMVDGVDDIVILGKFKLVNTAACNQVVDGYTVALRVDLHDALPEHIYLALADCRMQRVDLAISIADINIVVIDQGDMSYATACRGFCGPGTDTADTDDAKIRFLQMFECIETVYPRQSLETLDIVFA